MIFWAKVKYTRMLMILLSQKDWMNSWWYADRHAWTDNLHCWVFIMIICTSLGIRCLPNFNKLLYTAKKSFTFILHFQPTSAFLPSHRSCFFLPFVFCLALPVLPLSYHSLIHTSDTAKYEFHFQGQENKHTDKQTNKQKNTSQSYCGGNFCSKATKQEPKPIYV